MDATEDEEFKGDSASVSRFSQTSSEALPAASTLSPPSIRTLSTLQATLLALLAAFAWAVACSGTCLLAWLLLSRMYLPKQIEWDRPLYFDYGSSISTAVALVPLTHDPDTAPGGVLADPAAGLGGAGSAAWSEEYPLLTGGGGGAGTTGLGAQLLLAPGRVAQVSVRLRLPAAIDQDLFQVTGELITADGKLLGRSARTHVPRPHALLPRMILYALTAPWAAIGLYDNSERVELLLFDGFGVPGAKGPAGRGRGSRSSSEKGGGSEASSEQLVPSMPAYFRAKLVGRSPASGPPRIYSADMHLRLKLGWIESFLFHLSPGPIMAVVLLASGAAMALGGGGFAGALLIAALAVFRWGRRAAERLKCSQEDARRRASPPAAAAGGYGDDEDDALSGQWTPLRDGNGAAFGAASGVSRAGAMGQAAEEWRRPLGDDGSGSGEGDLLEPASPFEAGQEGGQEGREASGLAAGKGPAVAAIRTAVEGGRSGGRLDNEDGECGGSNTAGSSGDGGWQRIVAGGDASPYAAEGSPAHGPPAVSKRRGWPFVA